MSDPEHVPVGAWAGLAALLSAGLVRGVPAVWRWLTGAVSGEAAALRAELAVARSDATRERGEKEELRASLGSKVDGERAGRVRAEAAYLEILTWLRAKHPAEADLFEPDAPTGIRNVVVATRAPGLPPAQERRIERYARTGDPSTPPEPLSPGGRLKTPR